jgi:hypothetical protein
MKMDEGTGPEIFDSVHGPVVLHPASFALIATREFQRLKSLKQVIMNTFCTYWHLGRLKDECQTLRKLT